MSIVNLTIKVASEEITISLEEAKKLYNELAVLFYQPPKYDWTKQFGPITNPLMPKDVWYGYPAAADTAVKVTI